MLMAIGATFCSSMSILTTVLAFRRRKLSERDS